MKKIVFVFDRVAHYHKELFHTLESRFAKEGIELHLLSGETDACNKGRVGLPTKVVTSEYKYRFREYQLGSFIVRKHVGVIEQLKLIRPDVVVLLSHVGNISHWQLMGLKKKLGFNLIAWQCGYEYNPGRFKTAILRRFIPKFDHHLAYHSNARTYALDHGAREDQVTVMHNTINEERITCLPKAEARALLIARHPEIGNRFILLFVGAVLAEKRIEVILQTLDLLSRKDVVLLLVGDGEHLPSIRAACNDRNDVILTGSIVEGVGPYFDAAEMYLLPGTGGLGINEAMAHGLPIVSGYADGSADDLVVDGVNGFRLRDGSPAELAERITCILDTPGLGEQMGYQSRELITGRFAFEAFISRITKKLVEFA
jgi:glycosyltransferase involved in cell wall biosynthesis